MARRYRRRYRGRKRRRVMVRRRPSYRRSKRYGKRGARSKIIVPRNTYAPPKCFIKLRQTIKLPTISNIEGGNLIDIKIKGNSLNDWSNDILSDSYLGAPFFQYAQLYNKYYVYASRIKVYTAWIGARDTTSTSRNMYTFVHPSKDVANYTDSTINYNISGTQGSAPEDLPFVKGVHWQNTNIFKQPFVIRNKCTTKRIFQKNTKTDDDFTGALAVSPVGLSVTCTDPVNVWVWHLCNMATINAPDVMPEDYYLVSHLVTVTYYVMLYQRKERLAHVQEV